MSKMEAFAERSPIGKLPRGWELRPLRDLATKVGSGATPLGGKSVYLQDRVSHALIRSQHVFDRRFDATELAFISEEAARDLRNAEVRSGDILLNITGDGVTFGRACLVPDEVLPACVNQHVSIIRLNRDLCEPGYLLSFLTHPLVKTYMESFNTGGSRRAITKGHIEAFLIPLPPMPVQRRIAGILSAFDELIANSQRRIRILEEMARALYHEWFIEFRFPGHAKSAREVSSLGNIPKGWKVSKLGEILELRYGKALKEEDRREGAVPVYGSSGIVGAHDVALVDGPGIVVGRKGNVGSVYWSNDSFYPIDTVYFVASDLPLRFLYHNLQTKTFLNSDAAVPGLNRTQAYSMDILVPSQDLIARFSEIVDGFGRHASLLQAQCEKLCAVRDLALPRLMKAESFGS